MDLLPTKNLALQQTAFLAFNGQLSTLPPPHAMLSLLGTVAVRLQVAHVAVRGRRPGVKIPSCVQQQDNKCSGCKGKIGRRYEGKCTVRLEYKMFSSQLPRSPAMHPS